MQYLGNINITVRYFFFLCWNFFTLFFIHNILSYCIFLFSLLADDFLVILGIKNKETLICYCNAYSFVFFKKVRKNVIMLEFSKYFHAVVPYCKIKSNILFPILNPKKSVEQRTCFSTFLFTTCPWLTQPVYVYIWPSEWLWDLFCTTELELNMFWPFPF